MTVVAEVDLLRAYPTAGLPPQVIARIEELAAGSEPVSAFVYRPEVAATRADAGCGPRFPAGQRCSTP